MTGPDLLTVIIPTWNGCPLLQRCLQSLRLQTAHHRTLVVDNGSTDETAVMLGEHFPDVELLRLDRNLGFAAAVNRGLERTDTPFVALLNNDTEVDPDWVREGLAAFDHHSEPLIVASLILNFFARDIVDSAGDCYGVTGMAIKRGNGEPAVGYQTSRPVLGASAGAAFYRRELFDLIGFFDEDFFMYLEDVDLSLRAQLAGFGCRFASAARVYHVEAASDPDRTRTREDSAGPEPFYSRSRVYWITRNRWLLMATYQPWRSAPWLVYGWIRSFFFHLLKAGYWLSFLQGLTAGLLATPQALFKRRRLRSQRRLTTGELWQLLRKC